MNCFLKEGDVPRFELMGIKSWDELLQIFTTPIKTKMHVGLRPHQDNKWSTNHRLRTKLKLGLDLASQETHPRQKPPEMRDTEKRDLKKKSHRCHRSMTECIPMRKKKDRRSNAKEDWSFIAFQLPVSCCTAPAVFLNVEMNLNAQSLIKPTTCANWHTVGK